MTEQRFFNHKVISTPPSPSRSQDGSSVTKVGRGGERESHVVTDDSRSGQATAEHSRPTLDSSATVLPNTSEVNFLPASSSQ